MTTSDDLDYTSGPKGITIAQYKAALAKHACSVPLVARELGVARSSVRERIANNPELQEFIEETEEVIVASARNVIVHAIVVKKSERWSAWWLERRAKEEFSTRAELTGANGSAIPVAALDVTIRYVAALPAPEDEEVPV